MLKFQTEYNTYIKTFEDFILTTFVIIDDLYKKFAPYQVAHRRNLSIAKLSDSEIIKLYKINCYKYNIYLTEVKW